MKAIITFTIYALIAGCASAPQRQADPAPVAKVAGTKTIKCNEPDFGVFGLLPPVKIAALVVQHNCKADAMDRGYDVIEDSQ